MPRRRRSARGRLRLEVANLSRRRLPPRRLLRRAAELALAGLRPPAARRGLTVSLVCAGARRMAALNRRHLGRRGATDVLAFPLEDADPQSGRLLLGEVVVCPEVAARQARLRGLSFRGELLLYVVHGCLHLAGWDDDTAPRRRRMAEAERRVLARLGFPRDGRA